MSNENEARGADAVAREIGRIEERVLALANETGARFTYTLNEPKVLPNASTAMAVALAAGMVLRNETVHVDRRGGTWGLFYRRAGISQDRTDTRLRDASLEVRRSFLREAGAFASAYRQKVDEHRAMLAAQEEEDRRLAQEADAALEALGPADPPPPKPRPKSFPGLPGRGNPFGSRRKTKGAW